MGVSRRTIPIATAVLLTTCGTACSGAHHSTPRQGAASAPAMRLVAYDSCQALLNDLRTATAGQVGPYGLSGAGVIMPLRRTGPALADGPAQAAGSAYSGTNVQVAGVDEPDMVKTDGHRIVVAAQNKLRILDAA